MNTSRRNYLDIYAPLHCCMGYLHTFLISNHYSLLSNLHCFYYFVIGLTQKRKHQISLILHRIGNILNLVKYNFKICLTKLIFTDKLYGKANFSEDYQSLFICRNLHITVCLCAILKKIYHTLVNILNTNQSFHTNHL